MVRLSMTLTYVKLLKLTTRMYEVCLTPRSNIDRHFHALSMPQSFCLRMLGSNRTSSRSDQCCFQ